MLLYFLPPWPKRVLSVGKAVWAITSSQDCHSTLQWELSRTKRLTEHFKLTATLIRAG